ncbi:S-adenosyl-L-methionine-dependent methyltransferase [Amniculicola lignicola CBS 123094]|uniref:DNA (cytosine-5-)-methyltransferase n=1 Tax=Amniculicola lignicola CBS 123094 TaxID=1392246 RepID=A0A6A5WF69_9PLEO|nr:S-adenosyl-L-methionine-dependent methyltransferase [Amniculicola lignicola CBS 123094]
MRWPFDLSTWESRTYSHNGTMSGLVMAQSHNGGLPSPALLRVSGLLAPKMDDGNDSTSSESDSQQQGWGFADDAESQPRHRVEIMPGLAEYPAVRRENWESPLPAVNETRALQNIQNEWHRISEDRSTAIICYLEDFSIYFPTDRKHHPSELTSLEALSNPLTALLMFSGILRIGAIKQFVKDAPFEALSIEGYGSDHDTTMKVFIKSVAAQDYEKTESTDVWYELCTPAVEYQAYFTPFLWVAQFGKYVVDYLDDQSPAMVGLGRFREHFDKWLQLRFPNSPVLRKWRNAFRREDYRQAFNAHNRYLYFQAADVEDSAAQAPRTSHPVFSDCGWEPTIQKWPTECDKTIATPLVYRSFRRMYFGEYLEQSAPVESVQESHNLRLKKLGFIQHIDQDPQDVDSGFDEPNMTHPRVRVNIGDIITVPGDGKDHMWGRSDIYHAYVQGIEHQEEHDELSVIWMYTAAETVIGDSHYAIKNELFLSDHCNCRDPKLLSTEVLGVHTIDWFPRALNAGKDFIVRQKYIADGSGFVTAKESDKRCECHDVLPEYAPGVTVYVSISSKSDLEPAIVESFDRVTQTATVRELLRIGRLDPLVHRGCNIPPNELALTENVYAVSAEKIVGKCQIRLFPAMTQEDRRNIPFPYNQQGRWHYWYIASKLDKGASRIEPFTTQMPRFKQGLDPVNFISRKPLRGMSLFSGGGGLDRGLEAAGGVEFETIIDMDKSALLTQKANAADDKKCRFICASVDDVLQKLLRGDDSIKIGDVQCICAGSPCQGYSRLQQDRYSEKSLRNVSHITTWCSYVDLLRPEYGILENVVNVCDNTGNADNILGQVIATLVGMGYQTQAFIENAWNYGSSQRRSRLFVAIAAPGVQAIDPPQPTHSDIVSLRKDGKYMAPVMRSLGKLPCGVRFGHRDAVIKTPFRCLTANDAIGDLPNIGSGVQTICIQYPDHRVAGLLGGRERQIMRLIPTFPPGYSYVKALANGLIPKTMQQKRTDYGKSYTRINPRGLLPTITTKLSPRCNRTGAVMHPTQHRQISVQETRRAQGWPDNEVVIGKASEQLHTIGNGVDRNCSSALGFSFRYAWEASDGPDDYQFNAVPAISGLTLEDNTLKNGIQATLLDLASRSVNVKNKGTSSKAAPMDLDIKDTIDVGAAPFHYTTTRFYDFDTGKSYELLRDGTSIYDTIVVSSASPMPTSQPIPGNPPKRQYDDSDDDDDDDDDEPIQRWPKKRTRGTGHTIDHVPRDWSEVLERKLSKCR